LEEPEMRSVFFRKGSERIIKESTFPTEENEEKERTKDIGKKGAAVGSAVRAQWLTGLEGLKKSL